MPRHASDQEPVPFHLLPAGPFSGGRWTVLPCEPRESYVDTSERRAAVPFFATREDGQVQLHESAHAVRAGADGVDLTFAAFDDYSRTWRKMCEEVAIEAKMLSRGLDIRQARDHFAWETMPQPSERLERGLMFMQLGYSEAASRNPALREYFSAVVGGLTQADVDVLTMARDTIALDWSGETCDRVARGLAGHFAPRVTEPEKPKVKTGEQRRAEGEAAQKRRAREAEEEAAERRLGENENAEHGTIDPCAYTPKGSGEKVREPNICPPEVAHLGSGAYKIDLHRHTVAKLGARCRGSNWRASQFGGFIRYPSRALVGGKMYARRNTGGTVLVDGSGSMGPIGGTLETMLADFPAVWVGFYSEHADSYEPVTGFVARLCVVAENGRLGSAGFADEREHTGGNGGSDPVCLHYVTHNKRLRPPFIWVSDGYVGHGHVERCEAHMRDGRVVRVETIQDALAYLQGKKVETFRYCPSH